MDLTPSLRYPINLLVRYAVPPEGGRSARGGVGRTRDLSRKGACLDLPERVSAGGPIHLLLEDETGSLDLRATVVWTQKDPSREADVLHGVIFSQLPAEQQTALERLLEKAGVVPSRIILPDPLPGVAQGTLEVHLLDVSPGGARLEHCTVLRPGFLCTLVVPAASGVLDLTARVVRSRIVGEDRGADDEWHIKYETGLAFTLTPEQTAALAHFIEHLSRESEAGTAQVLYEAPALDTQLAPR